MFTAPLWNSRYTVADSGPPPEPSYPEGIIAKEASVRTPGTTSPGTTFSVTGIPWSNMGPNSTRVTTVVLTGRTGRDGTPSVLLRNSTDTSTQGEFQTQYFWESSPGGYIVLIASIPNPSNNTNAIRVLTPGSSVNYRDFSIILYNSRNMQSLTPVDTYFSEKAAFTDQYTNHAIDTRTGGFIFGAIARQDDSGSPYPDPMYNYSPDWISRFGNHLIQTNWQESAISGVAPARELPQQITLDRKTTKSCVFERVHMISLR